MHCRAETGIELAFNWLAQQDKTQKSNKSRDKLNSAQISDAMATHQIYASGESDLKLAQISPLCKHTQRSLIVLLKMDCPHSDFERTKVNPWEGSFHLIYFIQAEVFIEISEEKIADISHK